jgi:pyruvate dehydrogenase E1 component beta subunit
VRALCMPLMRWLLSKRVPLCRCVAVEEGWPHCGIASEISASIMELAFDELDAPVERVTGVEVPMPYAANLEAAALPSVADVMTAAKKVCGK